MKRYLFVASVLLAVVAFAYQRGLPPALAKHASNLKEAGSMKAKLSVREVGGKSIIVEITYTKPNSLRIDTPTELVVSDGETLTVLDKEKNTFTQQPIDKNDLLARTSDPAVWGWASFLQSNPVKLFKSAEAAGERKRRGVDISQTTIVLPERDSTATMFIETKTGVARGYMLKIGDKQWVVWAESIEISKAGMDASSFAFVAPEGAELIEVSEDDVAYSDVQSILSRNCGPCHTGRSEGGLSVRNYRSLMSSRKIVEGDPGASRLIQSLRGTNGAQRMPQGGRPLADEDIEKIEAWIEAGAKE